MCQEFVKTIECIALDLDVQPLQGLVLLLGESLYFTDYCAAGKLRLAAIA